MEPSSRDHDLDALLAQHGFVHALARRLLADEHAAEDVAQSALAGVLEARRTAAGSVRGYLVGTLRHLVGKQRRARARRGEREERAARPERVPATDAIVAREEWRERVVAAVRELEPHEREVVLLRYFEGLPPRRIARALGVPVGTVKARLARGLANLRPRLAAGRRREELLGGLAWLAVPPATSSLPFALGALVMGQAARKLAIVGVVLLAGGAFYALLDPPHVARDAGGGGAEEALESAGAARLEASVTSPEVATPQAEAERELALPSPSEATAAPALRARVVRVDDGRPLEALTVAFELEGAAPSTIGVTDGDGRIELALAEPARLVRASVAAGPRSAAWVEELGLDLAPGGAREIELRVSRGLRVRGLVLGDDEEPVVGAEVLGWCSKEPLGEPARRARADGAGRFELEHLGLDFYVEARAPGRIPCGALVGRSGALEVVEDLVLRLGRPAALHVVVRDEGGDAVAGAELRVTAKGSGWGGQLTRFEDVYLAPPAGPAHIESTDASGECSLAGLPAIQHEVQVAHAGFETQARMHVPGDATLEVVLMRGVGLNGIVLAADGRPVAGAEVRLYGVPTTPTTRTDDAGRFAFEGVQFASFGSWLAVRAADHAAFVHEPVRAEDSPLVLRLEPALAIAGVVVDVQGAPATDVVLRIEGERLVQGDAERSMADAPTWEALVLGLIEVRTDELGRFRFDGLYEGDFELSTRFEHEGVSRRQSWPAIAGEEDLHLMLDPAHLNDAVLAGRVRDALTGEPVREFSVVVLGQRADVEGNAGSFNSAPQTFRVEDGRYEIGGIAPMTLGVFVKAPGYRDQGVAGAVRGPGRHEIDVELHPVRSLAVRVVDGAGLPLAGVHLMVHDAEGRHIWVPNGRGGSSPTLATDAAGAAILQNLPATPIEVQAYFPSELRAELPADAPDHRVFAFDLGQAIQEVQVLVLDPR